MNTYKFDNLLKDPQTNWKFIWIVVILGFLAGAGILGYYYLWIKDLETKLVELERRPPEVKTPKEVPADETANWKTYRNEKYGFEVKYPEDWNVRECGKLSPSVIDSIALNPDSSGGKCTYPFVSVSVNVLTQDFGENLLNSYKTEPIIVNNIKGAKILAPYHLGTEIIVILPLGKDYITINAMDIEYEEIFNQMLSTFQFLK